MKKTRSQGQKDVYSTFFRLLSTHRDSWYVCMRECFFFKRFVCFFHFALSLNNFEAFLFVRLLFFRYTVTFDARFVTCNRATNSLYINCIQVKYGRRASVCVHLRV